VIIVPNYDIYYFLDVDDEEYDWLEYMTLEGKPEEMSWAKWALYKAGRATGHTLKYMDSWGESLADDFGLNKDPYKELIDRHNELASLSVRLHLLFSCLV
jgi:hypothetical protein